MCGGGRGVVVSRTHQRTLRDRRVSGHRSNVNGKCTHQKIHCHEKGTYGNADLERTVGYPRFYSGGLSLRRTGVTDFITNGEKTSDM